MTPLFTGSFTRPRAKHLASARARNLARPFARLLRAGFASRVRVGLCAGLLLVGGCGAPEVTEPPVPFRPIVDMKGFMNGVLDPAADVIWGSAGTISTLEGDQDLAPVTDEGWTAVRNAGALVAESGNLLMLPGRRLDDADWVELAQALMAMGERAMAAADARDGDAVFEVGGQLYNVCVACHQRYIFEVPETTAKGAEDSVSANEGVAAPESAGDRS